MQEFIKKNYFVFFVLFSGIPLFFILFKVPEWKLKKSSYRTYFILDDYNQRCDIVMQLTNEVDRFDRITKFYILNFKDYFKIKVLKIAC